MGLIILNEKNDTLESVKSCPLCEGESFSHWSYGKDILYAIAKNRYEYVSCQQCNFVFLKERYLEDNVGSLYSEEYDPYNDRVDSKLKNNDIATIVSPGLLSRKFNKVMGSVLKKLFKDQLKIKLDEVFVKRIHGKTLLDFGCGSDAFLNRARDNGWLTTGMDFNEQSVAAVIASGHRGVHYQNEDVWSSIEDNSLDVIRLNHVIEHLYHPIDVLVQLRKKLRDGGVLYMSTPNVEGVSANKFKSFWWGMDCPRHVMLYSPGTMEQLIRKSNYSDITIYHEESSKDYLRSLTFQKSQGANFDVDSIFQLDQNRKLIKHFYSKTKRAAVLGRGDRIHAFISK